VGIGTSFGTALADALNVTLSSGGPGSNTGGGGGHQGGHQTGTIAQRIQSLLEQANQKYIDAQTALQNGDLGLYQQLNQDAANLVGRALVLQEQLTGKSTGGATTSPTAPSGTSTAPTPTTPSSSG
jgi:uncharacterized protein